MVENELEENQLTNEGREENSLKRDVLVSKSELARMKANLRDALWYVDYAIDSLQDIGRRVNEDITMIDEKLNKGEQEKKPAYRRGVKVEEKRDKI